MLPPAGFSTVSAISPHLLQLSELWHWASTKRGGYQVIDEGRKLAVPLVGWNGRRHFDQGSKDRLIAACLTLAHRY